MLSRSPFQRIQILREDSPILITHGRKLHAHARRLINFRKPPHPSDSRLRANHFAQARKAKLDRERLALLEQKIAFEERASGGEICAFEQELAQPLSRLASEIHLDGLSDEAPLIMLHSENTLGSGPHCQALVLSQSLTRR